MSQFLICKAQSDLSSFGVPLTECKNNLNLYRDVVNYYFDGITENVWVIEKICNWIYDADHHMDDIKTIVSNSDMAVFWYGSEFMDLDSVYSHEEVVERIKQESSDSSIELYLLYKA